MAETAVFTVVSNERRTTARTSLVVDEDIAKFSPIFLRMANMQHDRALLLKNTDAQTLALVRDWLLQHKRTGLTRNVRRERRQWDEKFIEDVVNKNLVYELLMAASELQITELMNMAARAFAQGLRAPPEGLRLKFNLEDNFTPAEKHRVTRDLRYC